MSAGQLWLFPPPKPLVERLGKDFFQKLPPQPGVYLMCGEREGVLYVGSAKNLRKRLSSYRVANPERFPRRVIRLLNEVRRIEFIVCASEISARFREEELIRFVVAQVQPRGEGVGGIVAALNEPGCGKSPAVMDRRYRNIPKGLS